jgi:hypothetical protein
MAGQVMVDRQHLVEMLRQGSLTRDDYRWKAADEITRLTEEVEAFKAGNRDLRLHWDVLRADYETLTARVAQLEGALRLALPVIDEAFRWHRDTQSAPSRINETVRVLEAVRAALTQPAEGGE